MGRKNLFGQIKDTAETITGAPVKFLDFMKPSGMEMGDFILMIMIFIVLILILTTNKKEKRRDSSGNLI